MRFQLYLIFHLPMFILMNNFLMNNFLKIYQIYMPHYTHNTRTVYIIPCRNIYTSFNSFKCTDIHHNSFFVMNYTHFHSIHICAHMIHAELNLLFDSLLLLNYILLESYFLLYLEHKFQHMDHQ